MGNELTTTTNGQQGIPTPPSQAECRWIGSVFAASGFFTDARQAAQAITKILAGRELGIGPLASMTGIYIVKNRVTYSANVMAAVIQKSGLFDYEILEHTNQKCAIQFFRINPKTGEQTPKGPPSVFTMEDAKAAGLGGGDNWRKFPRNMLFARAMTNGARWHCPSLFGGSAPYLPDELDPSAKMVEGGEYAVTPLASIPTSPQEVLDAPREDLSPLHQKLHDLCEKTGTDPVRIYTYYHAESFSSMNEKDLKAAIKHLELKAETEEIPA